MNRYFIVTCALVLLTCSASCQDSATGLDYKNIDLNTSTANQKYNDLLQRARTGDADAYKTLAICYRDGDGVEKSWVNMICMYIGYCKKTGENPNNAMELFRHGHPLGRVVEILNSFIDEKALEELDQVEMYIPAEVKTIKAINGKLCKEIPDSTLGIIREAENEGSELAALIQIIYYEESGRKNDYEQCLIRLADKYPFLNLKLGELWEEKHRMSKDVKDLQKSIEYYYKADASGMLTSKHACNLIDLYQQYDHSDLFHCDEQELQRLKVLANRTQ